MIFSSYSPQFWEHRLEWFEIQAARLRGQVACSGEILVLVDFRSRNCNPFHTIADLVQYFLPTQYNPDRREPLFRISSFRSPRARALYSVGDLWRRFHTFAPDLALAAYRFACLGDSYGTPPMAMSFDCARELVGSQSRTGAISRRIFAALPGYTGLSRYLRNSSDGCGYIRLRFESRILWIASMDRP